MPSTYPRVSIVLVCRNGGSFLNEALLSVKAQSLSAWELLFLDNGSTDGSGDVALRHTPPGEGGERWRIERAESPIPVGEARNRCVALARSEVIAFLDADDEWCSEKLAIQLELLDRTNAALVFSDAFVVDARGTKLGRFFQRWPPRRSRLHEALIESNFIPHSTVLARREVLQSLGGFDPELRIACDYDFWLRASRQARFDFVERPLASWRVHGTNLTGDFGRAYEENALIYRKLLAGAFVDGDASYQRRARRALAALQWKWGLRSLQAGEGARPALARIKEGLRCSGGIGGGVASLMAFVRRQLRGISLRIRMDRARRS